ncbi:MAG: preprotein translocase subunit YajC [Thermoleophilia bacterium]|nr:preprotein translocase subunit YajC [Thermoleophilia bacterium]MDH4338988.1 preprotein translocase subunit YajC [Thermoleophilia bacterium]MDH5281288.1 preprotein translocase subunit YajC [Thermoleophilia bacterium]
MSFLIIMVLLLVVMYVLMIRPQRQRQAQQQAMITGARVGDDVLTTGGIYGTVTEADGDDVVVEIAQGLQVHMTRRGIAAVLPPEADDDPDVVDGEALEADEPDDADEVDEAAVREGVEPVTSEGAADPTAGERG